MEKTNKTAMIMAILTAVAAAAMGICVKYVFPVCSGMLKLESGKEVAMKCHYTSVVLVFLAILLVINAVLALATKQYVACGLMTVVLAVFVFVVLSGSIGIGICMKTEMACHTTALYAKIFGVALVILGAAEAVLGAKKQV